MLQKPLSYPEYWQMALPVGDYLNALIAFTPPPGDPYLPHYAMNQQRVRRLRKTIRLETNTIDRLRHLQASPSPENSVLPGQGLSFSGPQPSTKRYWLVINEFWCGDGAQITPVIEALTRASEGLLETRVVFRDAHPELMDEFLTNGSRSVPKIIQLNEQFEVLGSWGPRPVAAQELVLRLKAHPETAGTYSEALHKWYADDHQKSIQEELLALLVEPA